MKTKAIIYRRISRSDIRGSSLQTQWDLCRELCEKRGYEIVADIVDDGYRRDDPDRPGIGELLLKLKPGMVVVAWRYDRLAGGVLLEEALYRQFADQDVTVEYVDGPTHDNSPEGTMIRQILSAAAEYERKIIGKRTKAAIRARIARGEQKMGDTPFGHVATEHGTEQCPIESPIVRLVLKLNEVWSWNKIAKYLTEAKIPPRSGKWHPQTIKRIVERHQPIGWAVIPTAGADLPVPDLDWMPGLGPGPGLRTTRPDSVRQKSAQPEPSCP